MSSRDDPETRTVMQVPAAAPAETGLASFSLYVVEGPDAGARYELDANHPSRILVGKSEACDVRLSDPSVSRRHLSLAIDGRRLHVQDLDSTNGTSADGVALVE